MAGALGVSQSTVGNYARHGHMPMHTVEAAREWCARLPARKKQRPAVVYAKNNNGQTPAIAANPKPAPIAIDTASVDGTHERLSGTILRLRQLEMATIAALERANSQDPTSYEAGLYRMSHLITMRARYDFESKLLKVEAAREKFIDIDRVHLMIEGAIAGAVQVLRRLPEIGRDAAERRRFEEFAAAVLKEFEFTRKNSSIRVSNVASSR